MTSQVAPSPLAGQASLPPQDQTRVTQWRVLRSEWTKLWSLRSTRWSLVIALIAGIGFGLLGAYFTQQHWSHILNRGDALNFDPIGRSLDGVFLAQLAIGVLGVLMITGEYATGMIRASFSAVPKRLPVLWAKLATFSVTAFVLMFVAALLAFVGAQHFLGEIPATTIAGHHIVTSTSLGQPHTWRAIFGAAGYLTMIGMLGVGIGTIVRTTAGGITTLAGILFILPALANVLPQNWNDTISPYFPSRAGESLFSGHKPDPTSLSPGTAFAVMILYVVVVTIVAAILLRKRDV